MRVPRAAIALAVVLVIVGSGCSVFGRDGREPASPPTDLLRLGLTGVESLDPTRVSTIDGQQVVDQIYDTLVSFDESDGSVDAEIATAWSVSDDLLTWTFELGERTFSNGAVVTATDVKATLDRAADRRGGSVVADLLEPVVGWADVDGQLDVGLAGVVATDEGRVTITLTEPWHALPAALAQPGLGIVAASSDFPDLDEDVDVGDVPPASGQYEVTDVTDRLLTLTAVDEKSRGPAAIEITRFSSVADAYAAFANGDVDWAPVPPDRIDEATDRFDTSKFRSFAAELFYAFDLRDPKWSDVRLREAVVRAVDRDAIVDEVYGDRMRPMRSFTVDGIEGGGADRCGTACDHDPDRARALLAEIGAPPPVVFVDFEADEVQERVATAVAEDLTAVGFSVEQRPSAPEEYEAFAVSGEQDLFRLGWVAAYPSADAFVTPLFRSTSPNNLVGYLSPAVDDLIGRARSAPAGDGSVDLYAQAEAAVFADFAVLPIGHFRQHWVVSDRVDDLVLSVMGTFDAASVRIERD